MNEFAFTKREYNCLLALRRKPRTMEYLRLLAETDIDGINIMLSRMRELFYVVNDEPVTSGLIKLNQIGETVAQAEFDRRFDMYLTRTASIAALILSGLALFIR